MSLSDPGLSKITVTSIITLIYIGAFSVAFPNSYYSKIESGVCYPHWPSTQSVFIYYVVFVAIGLLIPLAIAAFMYMSIAISVDSSSNQHNHTYSDQRRRENNFLFKTMLCTVTTFGLLTAPYAIFLTIYMALLTYDELYFSIHYNVLMSLNYVIFTLSATNSCMNPLIYARRGTKWLFQATICTKKGSGSFTSGYSVSKFRVSKWLLNSSGKDEIEDV